MKGSNNMPKTQDVQDVQDVQKVATLKVKLIKNIKYGDTSYKTGAKIEIRKDDYEEFKAAGVIFVEEDPEEKKDNTESK